jgi:hypothetical protein
VQGDPGYTPDAHRYRVELDGAFLTDCETADEEQGAAVCLVIENGKPVLEGWGGKRRFKRVVKVGFVKIISPANPLPKGTL